MKIFPIACIAALVSGISVMGADLEEEMTRTERRVSSTTWTNEWYSDVGTVLWSYKRNELKADSVYAKLIVPIEGQVQSVEKEDGTICVKLAASDTKDKDLPYADYVKCYFTHKHAAELAGLWPGDKISLKALCMGKQFGIVTFGACIILRTSACPAS